MQCYSVSCIFELFAGHAMSTAASGVIAHPNLAAGQNDETSRRAEVQHPDFARLNI